MALDGKEVSFNSPNEAIEHGIGLVPQELNLIPHLSVAENIFLGIRKLKKRFPHEIDWESIYKGAEDVLNMLGIKMDVRQEVGEMSGEPAAGTDRQGSFPGSGATDFR